MTSPPGARSAEPSPGIASDTRHLPAHWLFARLGKRILRPGGKQLTVRMLRALTLQPSDDVVEFAPGLGTTARLVLSTRPASYIGVERDQKAARLARGALPAAVRVIVRPAGDTKLESGTASVVFGEALLTLQPPAMKTSIVCEAHRLLGAGGRLAVHELALTPDEVPTSMREQLSEELAAVLRFRAKPMTVPEWCRLLEDGGFEIESTFTAPVRLLDPWTLVADEGVLGLARVAWNLSRDPHARDRVRRIRRTLARHKTHLAGVAIIARKKDA